VCIVYVHYYAVMCVCVCVCNVPQVRACRLGMRRNSAVMLCV
jgi:hypothetical protein